MIAGILSPSTGSIQYTKGTVEIPSEEIFSHISIAAPYLELVEEFTLAEQVMFQQEFKPFCKNISAADVAQISELKTESEKQIRNFSSGMKQRLKVALAVLCDVPVVLLDEPTTNLDQKGFEWYIELMKNFSDNRLVIVSSNLEREYSFCREHINILQYK